MYNGIINVYKEAGYTSHDVVAKLRGILGQKKIGHTGTLDPDAVGVLPVCLGNATKLCDMLTDKSKEYRAVLLLGVSTDTEDVSGRILEKKNVSLNEAALYEIIESFTGDYDQVPPMYSAIKVGGKKLYELARAGVEVPRRPRKVHIDSICDIEINLPRVAFTVACSKGTYIRTLCHDIGDKAGCGGCMEKLVRTRVGSFSIDDSVSLGRIQDSVNDKTVEGLIHPTDSVFNMYPAVYVSGRQEMLVKNGNMFNSKAAGTDCDRVRVYIGTPSVHSFAGIYEYCREKECFKPVKMFLSGE